ncbi:MAG: THUMP-like domain-containing protein [Sphingobacteriaceae bacterium]
MNTKVFSPEIQAFIKEHLQTDITKLILKKPIFEGLSNTELAQQIQGKVASEKKLPTWFHTTGIYFPKKLAIEQSSSEKAAAYKSLLIKGESLLDLTGGFGVDSYYFSKTNTLVTHVEQQAELSAVAQYNAKVLGAKNIEFIANNGLSFLAETDRTWEVIYIDPSRRVASQKVVRLSDCEPNVIDLYAKLTAKCNNIWIKAAPLLDIKLAINELKNVHSVHVVSVGNEVKELLFRLTKQPEGQLPLITCVQLNEAHTHNFSFTYEDEQQAAPAPCTAPKNYLYEPNAAWLKAGCFKLIAARYGVQKLHQHTHLYTSDTLIADFPGKVFTIVANWTYTDFGKTVPVKQANCISRNFPLQVVELQKKHKLADGGNSSLFFFTDHKEQLRVVQATRNEKSPH